MPNLSVRVNSKAARVLFDDAATGRRAVGMEYVDVDTKCKRRVHARHEVVLAGGSFYTPQLLMLSGIGPKDHLVEMGIPVRVSVGSRG